MTSTPDETPDAYEDQDAEPTLNTTEEARPDGQEPSAGGSTDDVI